MELTIKEHMSVSVIGLHTVNHYSTERLMPSANPVSLHPERELLIACGLV